MRDNNLPWAIAHNKRRQYWWWRVIRVLKSILANHTRPAGFEIGRGRWSTNRSPLCGHSGIKSRWPRLLQFKLPELATHRTIIHEFNVSQRNYCDISLWSRIVMAQPLPTTSSNHSWSTNGVHGQPFSKYARTIWNQGTNQFKSKPTIQLCRRKNVPDDRKNATK